MKGSNYIFFILFLALLSCSSTSFNDSEEYLKWYFQNKNLVKHQEIKGVLYQVQYCPTEYLALKEGGASSSQEELDSLILSYYNSSYFLFEIDKGEEELGELGYNDFQEKLMELIESMGMYIRLKHNGVDVAPSFVHYERTFEVGNRLRFLVSFPVNNIETCDFIYQDDLWSKSHLKFHFTQLHNLPTVKIQ